MNKNNNKNSGFEDPVNSKIQKKFDSVFNQISNSDEFKENDVDLFQSNNGSHSLDDMIMDDNNSNKKTKIEPLDINLDFSEDFVTDNEATIVAKPAKPAKEKKESHPPQENESDLDFTIDFSFDENISSDNSDATALTQQLPDNAIGLGENNSSGGFTLESIDMNNAESDFYEKTRVTDVGFKLPEGDFELDIDKTKQTNTNNAINEEKNSLEETQESIESTIKDIIKPKLESTNEFKLDSTALAKEIEASMSADSGFDFSDVETTDPNLIKRAKESESTQDINFDSLEQTQDIPVVVTDDEDMFSQADSVSIPLKKEVQIQSDKTINEPSPISSFRAEQPSNQQMATLSTLSSDDSVRFQSTIRALREEREELLKLVKEHKVELKEMEQDNLSLKANLDEAKIEITILRKRHMVEIEDIKYRLTMSEEKKAMAEEKARQSELKKEKLEQKVRIDFNQVKHREKELESKLELLSMDVDSQVHSRDQKILELRRKIDALEFNMENASIKEQKSLDDKRKLEDRLNKIMKTLRHSIKNLEDDITEVDSEEHGKEKN